MNPAALTLQDAVEYLYSQPARTRQDVEDRSISLQVLGLLRDEWEAGPRLFDLACGMAVGLCHKRYLHKRDERAAFERREFLAAIPDYDYSTEVLPGRDPADGRRHYGNQHRKGRSPKRISSPAQREALRRAASAVEYFGA